MEHEIKEKKLSRLVISDQGFVFDPSSGQGYTANEVACFVIEGVMNGMERHVIAEWVEQHFDISQGEAEKDIDDLYHQLRIYGLI